MLVPEVKELFRCGIQHFTQFEYHIEGNSDFTKLDGTDMAAVNISQLGQLQLGEFFALAVINHIETELFIKLAVLAFHDVSPPHSLSLKFSGRRINPVEIS